MLFWWLIPVILHFGQVIWLTSLTTIKFTCELLDRWDGLSASIGAKAAAPDRPVICFTGDGGFSYHTPELETAKRMGLNVIVIVNNNECLSQGVKNLNIAYEGRGEGRKSECYVYEPTDFARIAQAYGCFGITVEKPEDFAGAFADAMNSGLPAVIDVKTEFAYQAQLAWLPT